MSRRGQRCTTAVVAGRGGHAMRRMKCWRVHWHHDFDDEPVVMYSQIGDDDYEARKVEIFRDGRMGWADEAGSYGGTGLGEIPVGPIADVREQADFTAWVISAEEFDAAWSRATGHAAVQADGTE
ncbi:DUF6881 domain-containing protein [Streptomyces smyrnaeus]|uniref:DUF6881 domain-containing protein n=1 Tax=Streptomyces smyrnaeus TaxID=1387713 RepID=UPI00340E3EF3